MLFRSEDQNTGGYTPSKTYSGSIDQKLWLLNPEDVVNAGKAEWNEDESGISKTTTDLAYDRNGTPQRYWTRNSWYTGTDDDYGGWCAITISSNGKTYTVEVDEEGIHKNAYQGLAPGFRIKND